MTTAAQSSTATIANELVALCREGRNLDAIERLYSPDIVSVEPVGNAQMPAEMKGTAAIRGKNEWWLANHDVHEARVTGPLLGDGRFAVHYDYDVTFKPAGRRFRMAEMALYTVKDGKIAREEFYYNVPGA